MRKFFAQPQVDVRKVSQGTSVNRNLSRVDELDFARQSGPHFPLLISFDLSNRAGETGCQDSLVLHPETACRSLREGRAS